MGQTPEARIRKLQDLCWSGADPDGRAFVHLADAYRKAGDLLEAGRVLREGLDRHPDFPSGHLVSAWVSCDRGRPGEAAESYRAALALDPRNIAALRGLAGILADEGELEAAVDLLEDLVREDPVDVGLPAHIDELRGRLATAVERNRSEQRASVSSLSSAWGDLEDVADGLDWESAALQEDLSPRGGEIQEAWAKAGVSKKLEGEVDEDVEAEVGQDLDEEVGEDVGHEVGEEVEEVQGAEGEARSEVESEPVSELGVEAPPEPWVAEDGVPAPSLRGGRDSLVTSTLGEIYLRQGYLEWAEEVFLGLLDRDPGSAALRNRLAEIRSLRREREMVTQDRTGSPPEMADASAEGPPYTIVLPIEDLAPDAIVPVEGMASSRRASAEGLAPSIILTVESLAPDAVVPIESLAPDAIGSMESIVPDTVVPIEFLAPDAIGSMESIVPDTVVPIEFLAPGAIGSIESLVPDAVVPIESLAPDTVPGKGPGERETAEEGKAGDQPALDAFQAWLDSLP